MGLHKLSTLWNCNTMKKLLIHLKFWYLIINLFGIHITEGSFRTPPKDKKDLDESVEILRPPKSAMNDTNKISKTKPRVSKPEPEQNRSNLSLNELRKVTLTYSVYFLILQFLIEVRILFLHCQFICLPHFVFIH